MALLRRALAAKLRWSVALAARLEIITEQLEARLHLLGLERIFQLVVELQESVRLYLLPQHFRALEALVESTISREKRK